jgi:PKD repeat protein
VGRHAARNQQHTIDRSQVSARRFIALGSGVAAPGRGTRSLLALTLAAMIALALAATAQAAPPTVAFQASPASARVNQSVGFAATATGNGGATIASLAWSFGDGGTGSGAAVTHTYASAGARTVALTATDSNGESAVASHNVQVVDAPTAAFTWTPTVPNVNGAVSLNANGSHDPGGAIQSYNWTFGDGTSGTGVTPSHSYATAGDKTVMLTITSSLDGHATSVSNTVHVNVPPQAAFVFSGVSTPPGQDPFTPVLGQQVAFNAQSSGDVDGTVKTWAWDLGTGTFGAAATVPSLTTTFTAAGNKDIRLQVTDDHGATAIATTRLRVNSPPVAAFGIAPATPRTGQAVTFSSTASDPDGVADLAATSWDLNGDGTYGDATGPTARATFLTAGTYAIGQRVTDKGGAATTTTKRLVVAGPPASPQDPGDTGTPPAVVPSPGAPLVLGLTGNTAGEPARASGAALRALRGVRVQLAGSVTGGRTRIARIVVVAPKGALVVARCAGGKAKGCPAGSVRRRVSASGRVRLTTLQRSLRTGARIVVSIAKPGFATKRIELTMRAGKAPARTEACLLPVANGKSRIGRCPAS